MCRRKFNYINMPVITLFNELGGTPSENGSWTYTSGPTPNPAPPVTWDGTIDTTGFANGNYVYTYTKKDSTDTCTDEATVTVAIQDGAIPTGDVVGDPIFFSNLTGAGQTASLLDQTFLASCPGDLAPTLSDFALPATWTVAYSGDLFYSVAVVAPSGAPEDLLITVTSSSLTDPLINPYVALYDGPAEGTLLADSGPLNPNTATLEYSDVSGLSGGFYIRVGTQTGNEGNFNILVTAQ